MVLLASLILFVKILKDLFEHIDGCQSPQGMSYRGHCFSIQSTGKQIEKIKRNN